MSVLLDAFEITSPELGVTLGRKKTTIRVTQLKDGPAKKCGKINLMDVLVEIDGENVKNCSSEHVAKLLKSNSKIKIDLKFSRSVLFGDDFVYNVSLDRKFVETTSVEEDRSKEFLNPKCITQDKIFEVRRYVVDNTQKIDSPSTEYENGHHKLSAALRSSESVSHQATQNAHQLLSAKISREDTFGNQLSSSFGQGRITIFLPDSIEARTKKGDDQTGLQIAEPENNASGIASSAPSAGVTVSPNAQKCDNFVPIFAAKIGKRNLPGSHC